MTVDASCESSSTGSIRGGGGGGMFCTGRDVFDFFLRIFFSECSLVVVDVTLGALAVECFGYVNGDCVGIRGVFPAAVVGVGGACCCRGAGVIVCGARTAAADILSFVIRGHARS